MARHPIAIRIDEAIDACEKYGVDVTVANVVNNAEGRITWSDASPDEVLHEALRARVARQLKDRGYIIADATTRRRKSFWKSTAAELEEQQLVKTESSRHDQNRILADGMVIDFLKSKATELGYDPFPELFRDDVERIYAMHGIGTPPEEAL